MKSETTKKLEKLLEGRFNPRRDFYVFECTIGWYGKEIVDCISYDTDRQVTCYEIKQSEYDFHSKSAVTFLGNKNYYVMPLELFDTVRDEIPPEIGVLVACRREFVTDTDERGFNRYYSNILPGFDELYCIKSARKGLLRADKEIILSSMLRSVCRDRQRGKTFAYETEEEREKINRSAVNEICGNCAINEE